MIMRSISVGYVILTLLVSPGNAKELEVKVWLNKTKDQLFHEGENLLISLEASQSCYVQVLYHDASKKSYLIYPNSGSSPDGKVTGKKRVTLGKGVDVDGFEFEIGPPFGGEMVRVYASSKPLPKPKGTEMDGGAIELKKSFDELDVFYHEEAINAQAHLTDASILLKTARQGEERNPEPESKQQEPGKELPSTAFAKPRIFALVVGVSQYASLKISSLRYADADAKMLAEFLESPDGAGVPKSQLRILLNEQATRKNILEALRQFATQATRNDMIVMYVACHGLTSMKSNATYFLSYDSDFNDLPNTAVDQTEITNILADNVQAGKIVFFIDACHGGGLGLAGVRLRGATSFLSSKLLVDLVTKKNGTVFFSAARAMEQSLEGQQWGGGHGIFTHFLLEGLRKHADADNNGKVTIDELAEYVTAKVKAETNGRQHPELKGYFDNELTLSVLR